MCPSLDWWGGLFGYLPNIYLPTSLLSICGFPGKLTSLLQFRSKQSAYFVLALVGYAAWIYDLSIP